MPLETNDKIKSETLGNGIVLKVYDKGEVGILFSDGEYIIPESAVEFVEKGARQATSQANGKSSRYETNGLTEDQDVFLILKTATVQEVMELCEDEKSAETIQRNIRALRGLGYAVSSTLNK